jgi:asparagine synthase (glutamine-hydrolysing)
MCGILSYYRPTGLNRKDIQSCILGLRKLKHRGPDGEGAMLFNIQTGKYAVLKTNETPIGIDCTINDLNEINDCDYQLFLGHRRLNIIDLSIAGHQPMCDTSGDKWMIFNGEIYNYLELREELKNLNHVFKSNSDTEVILESYKEWGKECFNRFNGMWSIVMLDISKKELITSNDRYGIKPLYYIKDSGELIFSSEIKPFFCFRAKIKDYDKSSINTYINYGYINYNEHTFFKEVKKFPKSHYSIIKLQNSALFMPIKYYDVNNISINLPKSETGTIEEFDFLIKDAVKLTLRSDVPLGVAISGGLDSSYMLYMAASLLKNEAINTYSAVFPGSDGDESAFINIAIEGLNCMSHFVNPMDKFTFEDFEKHIISQEYPVQSTSFYADWCVAKLVKDSGVRILLNGQGADEIFAGYHHHFYKYCSELIMKGHIHEYKKNLQDFCVIKGLDKQKVSNIVFHDLKQRIKSLFTKSITLHDKWINATNLTELLSIDLGEATLPAYLQSNDRNSMASSIESRLPFLDYRLVNFAMSLPSNYKIRDGYQKWIMRKAGRILPEAIRYRKDKKGFTTPEDEWIEKHKNEFSKNLSLLDNFGIERKNTFRHYSMALWLKNFKLNK